MITELNERSRAVFRTIVETYLETGEPMGSRTLSRRLGMSISPATIRNVMADLEDQGLLFAPHTSAGRLPTDLGFRLFVDGLLELGRLSEDERARIESQCAAAGRSMPGLLEEASSMLSGLSHCAGLVMAPKSESPLKRVEFVSLSPGRVLAVMVTERGVVENRLIEVPLDMPSSALVEAANFLNARLTGRTIVDAHQEILDELERNRNEIDVLASRLVEDGLATWAGGSGAKQGGNLIVRGQANLLDDVTAVADLERIRTLFNLLETKETTLRLLDLADQAQGVQIFIGAENELFRVAGCSMIVAPYRDAREQIVGAIGVIGPTRMSYARIIPMVDYTATVLGRMLG